MRRSRGRVALEILDLLVTEDRKKTALVYQANLSFPTASEFIERLVEQGLMAWNTRTKMWYATLAGKEAADHLRAVEALL